MQPEGKFVIPEPCHEDWNAMTPTQQGRFCAACQKCVIDLTAKKPAEIKEIYDANEGDVCGRMSVSQFVAQSGQPATDDLPYTNRVLRKIQLFALALLATFSFAFTTAKAQNHPIKGKIAHVPTDVRIEGQVAWDHGTDAAKVTVEVWQGEELVQSTLTDDKGRFAFTSLERGRYRIVAKAGHWIETEVQSDYLSGGKYKFDLVLEDVQVDGGLGYIEVEPVMEEVPAVEEPEVPMILGQIVVMEEAPCKCEPEVMPDKLPIVLPVDIEIDLVDPVSAESSEASAEELQTKVETAILDDLELTLYPNPTDDNLNIQLKTPSERPIRIFLFDMNGRALAVQKWRPQHSTEHQMSLAAYASGTYIVRMISGTAMVEKRIVKR